MAKKDKVTVIVLESFQDKYDHKTQYPVGAELQVDQERADDLVSQACRNQGAGTCQETQDQGTRSPESR